MINLDIYETIIVVFSGGKDSLACLLDLLDSGVDKSKIELWHHDVDGREGSELMDWPITPGYCQAIADAFEIPIYFSWKVGGFEREMLRDKALTAPTKFETPAGEIVQVGGTRGKLGTRLMFPQMTASLGTRYCSAYVKIDVCAAAIRNQKRFNNSRTLVVSGERAEESAARSHYATFEPDRSDNRNGRNQRHVDRYRPVHKWSEQQVWDIIEKLKVAPHPAYILGWGRVSCLTCIFGSCNQWASAFKIAPRKVRRISHYENEFGVTIHRTETVAERVGKGIPYQMDPKIVKVAMGKVYTLPVFVDNWQLPAGAFGESCGPI